MKRVLVSSMNLREIIHGAEGSFENTAVKNLNGYQRTAQGVTGKPTKFALKKNLFISKMIMKKLFIMLAGAFVVGTASAQTNDQMIKILEQAICEGNGIKNFLLSSGMRQVSETITPDDELTGDFQTLSISTYIDGENRLIKHIWSGMPESCWITHEISVRLIFPTHNAFTSTFAAHGFQSLLYDEERKHLKENPNDFILRKKYVTYDGEDYYIAVKGEFHVMGSQCIVDVSFGDPGVPVSAGV